MLKLFLALICCLIFIRHTCKDENIIIPVHTKGLICFPFLLKLIPISRKKSEVRKCMKKCWHTFLTLYNKKYYMEKTVWVFSISQHRAAAWEVLKGKSWHRSNLVKDVIFSNKFIYKRSDFYISVRFFTSEQ